jgi:hypothetical protein
MERHELYFFVAKEPPDKLALLHERTSLPNFRDDVSRPSPSLRTLARREAEVYGGNCQIDPEDAV